MDKFLFPVDYVVLDTEPVANMTNQIPVILGQPFLATSNAVIHYQSGQLEFSFGNLKVTLNVFDAGNHPPCWVCRLQAMHLAMHGSVICLN